MVYKIKLEDKAALMNKLNKQDIAIDTSKIKDNKLGGYFELTVNNPEAETIVKQVLKKSPKITKVNKMTKNQLKEMIREELGKMSDSQEAPMNEDLVNDAIPIVATLLGVGSVLAAAFAKDLMAAKTPEAKKQVLQNAANQIAQSKGTADSQQ